MHTWITRFPSSNQRSAYLTVTSDRPMLDAREAVAARDKECSVQIPVARSE